MKKIYKVHSKTQDNKTIAIGLLIDEDSSNYLIKTQNGINSENKKFDKEKFTIESIYEKGDGEYHVDIKTIEGKNNRINLPKTCFGGCG